MTSLARDRILPLVGFLAGFVVLAGLAAWIMLPQANKSTAAVGGPFTLTDQNGNTVTQAALDGHPTLVFFGYTHCPDTCPLALSNITKVFESLGTDNKAKALFITVDPQRDTPVVLKDYLSSFDKSIVALTGTPEAIKKVESDYKAYAKAVPDKDGTYSMDHTSMTYLMDKRGNFVGAFDLERPTKDAAAELKSYF